MRYILAEKIKLWRVVQLHYVVFFCIIITILWAFFLGSGLKIDGGITQKGDLSAIKIFFSGINYFILPFTLFIPFFCLQIEHNNFVLSDSYVVYFDSVKWILSKLFWVILVFEVTIAIALILGIIVCTYSLKSNWGDQFNVTIFGENACSFIKMYLILYLPNILFTFLISLQIKKFSNILMFIVSFHLLSIQPIITPINPFHSIFSASGIHYNIISQLNTLYSVRDENQFYVLNIVASILLIIIIMVSFLRLKKR